MSAKVLYHLIGARGYTVETVQEYNGALYLWVRRDGGAPCCPACGSRDGYGRGHDTRCFRTLPIGARRVFLVWPVPRIECARCGRIHQSTGPLAEPRRRVTRAFVRYVLQLLRFGTVQDVARHLQVGWDLVKEIHQRHLHRSFSKPKLKHLREIAIDEFHVGKGQRYRTLVLDLRSGAVVFVGFGKGADALKPFWKRLHASHAKVRAVAMDMSWAYIDAVRDHLPHATIVFDRFHLVKLAHEKLTQLRRELYHECTTRMHKQVLKGTRWLLLKNPEHLDERRRERDRLDEALQLNQPLATAYYLKEDLRQIWEQPDKARARRFLKDWIARAECTGIRLLQQLAKTVATHRESILAWYDCRISTSPLEGIINKIQTLKRKHYGFRDNQYFMLRILALHESRYELVG